MMVPFVSGGKLGSGGFKVNGAEGVHGK